MIPDLIVVHHSFTKDSGTVSWNAIRRYHVEELGWQDIGYHAGVELVETADLKTYEPLIGRLWDIRGAHEPIVNSHSLGICFVGNFDVEAPPQGQLIAGAKVIAYWCRHFGITLDNVFTHHNFRPDKTCPGTLFDMAKLKQMVRGF